jgi:hypothetical protein
MRPMSCVKRLLAIATAMVAATAYAASVSTGAHAAPAWAPADSAAIHPGIQMYTEGAQCTANFVYTDAAGTVYVGYAAHCAGTGGATETDGCDSGSLPLGTRVTFNTGGSLLDEGTQVGTGTLAYSSWLTMQRINERNPNTCAFNDLALVKVDNPFVDDVTRRFRSGAGRSASTPTALPPVTASTPTATRRCAPASRCCRPRPACPSGPPVAVGRTMPTR